MSTVISARPAASRGMSRCISAATIPLVPLDKVDAVKSAFDSNPAAWTWPSIRARLTASSFAGQPSYHQVAASSSDPIRVSTPRCASYLETNADIVTRITKPVRIDDIGALSAQSDQPILFENIVEKPGFRLCDILVKNRRSQARALGVEPEDYLQDAGLSAASAAARLQERASRSGEGGHQARRRRRLDQAADPVPQGQGRRRPTSRR